MKNAIFLTKKGEVFQLGEYFKEGEKYFSENPKRIDKINCIKQIWAGTNQYFAYSEARGLYGWGDNTQGQISASTAKRALPTPQSLRLSLSASETLHIVSGNSTTFLLSGQKVDPAPFKN